MKKIICIAVIAVIAFSAFYSSADNDKIYAGALQKTVGFAPSSLI